MTDLFPYRVLTDEIEEVAGNCFVEGPSGQELSLDDFEYGANVRVRRVLRLNPVAVRNSLSVSVASRVRLGLSYSSRATRRLGQLTEVALSLDGDRPIDIELSGVLPSDVSVDATISCLAVIDEASPTTDDGLSPAEPGTLIWTGPRERILLEGTAPRMPISAVPFVGSVDDPASQGLWRLDVDATDLDRALSGCVHVLMNSAHPRFPVVADPAQTRRSADLVAALRFDIIRSVLWAAMDLHDQEDLMQGSEDPVPGSLREFVLTWMGQAFPVGIAAAFTARDRGLPHFDASIHALTVGGER